MALSSIKKELACFDWHEVKNIETVGSWPVAVRATVLSTVFLAGLVPAWQIADFRLGAELQALAEEEAALRQELKQLSLAAEALPAQRASTLLSEESLGGFQRQLSREEQVAELLDSITAVGHDSRLEFVSVSLEPEQPQAFYTEHPIRMQVRGDYHDFASFISGVASLRRLVLLHDFTMERATGGRLTIDFTLHVYRQNDNPGGVASSGRSRGGQTSGPGSHGSGSYSSSYAGTGLRSAFEEIGVQLSVSTADSAAAPIQRSAEVLENFPLSALAMVGAIVHGSVTQALVRDSDDRVHRVAVGGYMGQDHGRVQRITSTRIDLMEIVQAGDSWVQRPRALLLQIACPACQPADE